MSFRDAVRDDIHSVFLNTEEFGELRTVQYDGEIFTDIPVVLTGLKERDRRRLYFGQRNKSDHVQGLYDEYTVMHCALADIGGHQPEKGQRIRIYDADGTWARDYRILASVLDMGMLRLELGGTRE